MATTTVNVIIPQLVSSGSTSKSLSTSRMAVGQPRAISTKFETRSRTRAPSATPKASRRPTQSARHRYVLQHDGKLEWTEIDLFVQREKHRLPVAPRVC